MIEALVDYIRRRGFGAYVIPGRLLIRTMYNKQLYGVDWAISREELNHCPRETLFDQCEMRLEWLEQAILAMAGEAE